MKNICRSIAFISFLFLIIFPAHRSFGIEHKLSGQNLTANDGFAAAVAIDGDYAVIGTPGDNSDKGSASIFSRNQGGTNAWGLVIQLGASDGNNDDAFGSAVAVSGQYVIIGAPGDDGSGMDAGSVYVYARNQGGNDHWGLVTSLTPETTMNKSNFGSAVAISGDNLIVGAPGDDDNGTNAGAVYIYARNQGGTNHWGLVGKLYAEGSTFIDGNPDNFGASVAIDGDYAIIGAPGTDDSNNGIDSGVAYVFYCDQYGDAIWGQQAKLAASDGGPYHYFAEVVSISGSIALVGSAVDNNANGSQAGAAYFFYRDQGGSNNWGERKKVIATNGHPNDHFGGAVNIYNNYAIIGSPRDDDLGFQAGAAYIIRRNEGGTDNWGKVEKLTASNGEMIDFFGTSVAINGDYNAVVGTPDKADNTGAAYVFDHNGNVSTIPVGSAAGLVTANVSATDLLTLQVNTSNSHNELPAQTWLVFMLVKGGQASSLYLLSNTAVEEITATTNFDNSQFSFTGTPVQTLVTLRMADLGLQSGDGFYYAYAYSTNDINGVVVENIVALDVQ